MSHPRHVTVLSFVGNPGCIRFPENIRKVSGIKRNDRLFVNVTPEGAVVLEKRAGGAVPRDAETAVSGCACASPPASCAAAGGETVTVGWSYVQLSEPLATRLGLSSNVPIQLDAERSRITVTLHDRDEDLSSMAPVRCPP